ncbi:MAG: hypothetical protein E7599_03010 [Ruminococcaceae bacterium]|nr:hypothetical protein [Oscillospiraceae bacterium]
MKKIISIILALLLIASAMGCAGEKNIQGNQNAGQEQDGQNNQNSQDDQNNRDPDNPEEEFKYVFYSGGSADGGAVAGASGFKDASELNFDLDKQLNTVKNQNKVSNRKEVAVDGQSYDFSYSYTRSSALSDLSRSELSLYGECDVYTATRDGKNVEMRVYNHTGNIRSWSRSGLLILGNQEIPADVTDEKVIEKARSIIQDVYGEDALDEYTSVSVDHAENSNAFSVRFYRDFHGYTAEACFFVVITNDMDIVKFSAFNHYEFNALENDVTEEMIKNAEQALRACVPSSMTVQENTVTVVFDVNTEKLYLELYARRNTPVIDSETGEESYVGDMFYVNIN